MPVLGKNKTRLSELNDNNSQPPKKKVKVSDSELKWSYHVNTRIKLKIICCEDDIYNIEKEFHPEYAHIFFGDDEQLSGYNEPEVIIYFNAWSFKSYIQFNYHQKHKVLPAPDPIKLITPYLAKGSFTTSLEEFKKDINIDRKISKPYGELVSTYTRENIQNPTQMNEYSIYFHKFGTSDICFDDEFINFHNNLQFFILLEIDGGTYIEAKDPRWEIFLLYETIIDNNQKYQHLIGYCTAYRFFAFPDGFRLRISQFLLFPPYQKCGHGRKLLQGVYDNAISRGVRDIPVEDPAPEFGRLRDMVDLLNLLGDNVFNENDHVLSKDILHKIIDTRKLWKNQIRRCFEIYRLAHINLSNDEEYKEYRLYVKRRIISQNREHLELFEKGEERKKEIHRMYEILENEYFQIIDKIRKYKSNSIKN